MLSALSAFFSNVTSWLIILKYVGLTLAAGSSVWATINVLTVETGNSRKHLTPAGYAAIGLTAAGLLISVVSDDLQRRHDAELSKQQVSAEARRTNAIIIAGQPLTSLSLTWSFHGIDAGLIQELKEGNDKAIQFIEDQQGERDAQQNGAVFREEQLYPYLFGLARRFAKDTSTPSIRDVTALVALDDAHNTVLPFGYFGGDPPWARPVGGKNSNDPRQVSVELGSHANVGNTDLQNWPNLETNQGAVTISWQLDPWTFAKSINRQNSFVVPTANPPNSLRIAILFDIKRLPFKPGNFALPDDQNFWNFPDYTDNVNDTFRGLLTPISKDFTSSVQLVPNNSTLIAFTYTLGQVYETLFLDTYGEASGDLRCVIFEYTLKE
jgi:hypothetical protein